MRDGSGGMGASGAACEARVRVSQRSAMHSDWRGIESWVCYQIGNHDRVLVVRVIARSTLARFVESLKGQRAVKAALDAWFHEAQRARWRNSAEVKDSYGMASILSADRLVFNIKGNDYRLVAAIDYRRQILFIKWIGTHAGYDRIDAKTDQHGD